MNILKFRWRSALAAASLCAAAVVSGCASVSYSSPGSLDGITIKGASGKPGQLVYIETTGYYFLWTLPLATGDLRWNADKMSIEGGTVLFRDMVSLDDVQNALVKIAESRGCDLVVVSYYDSDTSFAGASYGGMVGALFGSSTMSASAVLVPRKGGDK